MIATEPLSLSSLKDIERWPTRWRPALGEEGEWSGFWWCTGRDGDEDRVSADSDEDYANEFAALVASLVNSAPALIAIAKAALEWKRVMSAEDSHYKEQDKACEALDKMLKAVRP